ncbi:MAG: ABC transporter substrate-binding protein [Chloroflexi bacterium]|nr:ABC transporter substrate-binding protein [Chloroflexota bacterium]
MGKLAITLACGDYDRTHALADGSVEPEGVDLNYLPVSPPGEIFWRMLRHEEFDASELSLSNYTMGLARGDTRFVALPVFPYRTFRHSSIWINTEAGIREPRDLIGKRVGCPEYAMTALLFIRGLLQHEYDVPPEAMRWFRARTERVELNLPPGVHIQDLDGGQSLDSRLERGELDAATSASMLPGFLKGSPRIQRLFPNAREVEAEYYRRTRIFPIMHIVAIRRAVYERNRWLARSLAKAFQAAKERADESARRHISGTCSLPWAALEYEHSQQVFGGDPYPYGVEPNLPTLEAATLYSYEQGLSPRRVAVEELFVPEAVDVFGGV